MNARAESERHLLPVNKNHRSYDHCPAKLGLHPGVSGICLRTCLFVHVSKQTCNTSTSREEVEASLGPLQMSVSAR